MKINCLVFFLFFISRTIAISQISLCFDSTKKLTSFGHCDLKIQYPISEMRLPLTQDSNFNFDNSKKQYCIKTYNTKISEKEYYSIILDVSSDSIITISKQSKNGVNFYRNNLKPNLNDKYFYQEFYFIEDTGLKAKIIYREGYLTAVYLFNGEKTYFFTVDAKLPNSYSCYLSQIGSKNNSIDLRVNNFLKETNCLIRDSLNKQIAILKFDKNNRIQELSIYNLMNSSWDFTNENPMLEEKNCLKFNKKAEVKKSSKGFEFVNCCK